MHARSRRLAPPAHLRGPSPPAALMLAPGSVGPGRAGGGAPGVGQNAGVRAAVRGAGGAGVGAGAGHAPCRPPVPGAGADAGAGAAGGGSVEGAEEGAGAEGAGAVRVRGPTGAADTAKRRASAMMSPSAPLLSTPLFALSPGAPPATPRWMPWPGRTPTRWWGRPGGCWTWRGRGTWS